MEAKFAWNTANRAHLARHGIAPWLAEKIFRAGLPTLARADIKDRYIVEATVDSKHYRLSFAATGSEKLDIHPITAYQIKARTI
jgi:hypothetical protein